METTGTIERLNNTLAGRYVVEREIGHGGMATVYLARDVRHHRKVALKLLLAELGAILGPERFLSEIRVTANLQHPNLLPLFDSGEADGRLYYVMPYVDGESLRNRLDREKQLPVDESVRIACACASALDYAHRSHVIHRDLKPENILLSAGQPVIADFGIALAVSNAGGARITHSGLSLGTPQYMSPEQAAGDREVDGRSDIYSLACVLYEMLTGDPPHTGSTVQAVIAKVLVEKPGSVRRHRDRVPEHVDAAIERALAKLPADRWATAAQFGDALSDPGVVASAPAISDRNRSASLGPSRGRRDALRHWIWPAIAAAGVIAAVTGWWRIASEPPPGPVSFVVPTPASARLASDPSQVLFSPDGSSIVYVAQVGGERRLYIRRLDDLIAREIKGARDVSLPFFSPDGKWIGVFSGNNILYKVPVNGGTAIQIARTTSAMWRGGTWGSGGDIVLGGDSGLYLMRASGGEPHLITKPDKAKGENSHIQPMFLPDGKSLVFRIDDVTTRAKDRLAVTSIDRTGHELLGVTGGNPLALLKGRLFYGRPGGLIAAVPFDARRLRATGEATIVLDDVSVYTGAAASFASNGSLVYVRSSNASRLLITNEHAVPIGPVPSEGHRYARARLSPDGNAIAVDISSAGATRGDIWTYDISSATLSRLTSEATSGRPEWTPDGKYVVYLRSNAGRFEIWRVPRDGSGQEEKLFFSDRSIQEVMISPNGRLAVFGVDKSAENRDVWLLSLDSLPGRPRARPLLTRPFNEFAARISPDGRWLAYASDESGENEVYVRPFSGPGPKVQVSANGGTEPMWTSGGSRLIYRSGDKFIAAALATAGGIAVTARTELFDDRYLSSGTQPRYDVDASGKRFVLLEPVGTTEIVVVLNGLEKFLSTDVERR